MRAFLVFLLLSFSVPVIAQQDKVQKKSMGAKKAPAKVAPAKAGAQKKSAAAKKQEPSQDWGRFQSQSRKDEKERAAKAKK